MSDMLSYKSNQTVPPLYEYYVETDLDDQPVDYSKKYSDQDSYEDRRLTKSNQSNPDKFPASEGSQSNKPQTCRNSNDEVKIYCIEDTPITISSASSFGDLREVGTANSLQKTGLKRSFPITNDDDTSQELFEVKKSAESYDVKNDQPDSKDKDEINKEAKSVSFRDGEDISKASSPLMFSRSSSVCSLNSFEQHSIVDDRSSVSAFSALTSGIISPSDLPDSPGDIMPAVLTDKGNSPKMDSSKADSENEFENMELCENEKEISNDIKMKSNSSPATQLQLSKSTDYLTIPSNKSEMNSDMEENDILSQQLEFLHDSPIEMDEVFTNPEYEKDSFVPKNERDLGDQLSIKSDEESDEDDDILLQQCIQLGMPNKSPENKCDISVHKKVEYPLHTPKPSHSQVQVNKETNLPNSNLVTSENINFIQQPTVSNIIEEPPVKPNAKLEQSSTHENHPITCVELKDSDPVKSDSDSDDDMLLQRCIQLGMPKKSSDEIDSDGKFVKTVYSSPHVSHNSSSNMLQQTSVKFDDDDSDGDDILLQQCIQLGMPNDSTNEGDVNVYKNRQSHAVSPKSTNSQVPIKKEAIKSNESPQHRHSLLTQCCMQYESPQKLPEKISLNAEAANVTEYSSPRKQNRFENNAKTPFPSKSEIDSDEDDILLHHCIQLGMPNKPAEKKSMHSRILNKPEFTSHSANICSPNDLRDGCPDGISDGDEEDDLLAQCIRAGMPSPKTVNDVKDRLHNSHANNISRKLQTPNQSFLPNTSTESNKKFGPRLPPNQPSVHSGTAWISNTSFIDVDSMRIYRTEDTPILSPSASISDLSSLSFNGSFLNNSRNSDCSSESDDDELLRQCIRSGMPEAKRAVA